MTAVSGDVMTHVDTSSLDYPAEFPFQANPIPSLWELSVF